MNDPEALIQAVVEADSPSKLVAAVRTLASARLEAGISTLIKVLGYNNPGAAVAAVEGLIQMGEVAVKPILEELDPYNYGARAYAIRALAAIGDPRALDLLLKAAATDFAPSVRRSAAKGLGTLRWQQLPPEQIAIAQTKAREVLEQLCRDIDWSIRYAAIVGLQALATNSNFPEILAFLKALAESETDLAIRARVELALNS